MMLSNVVADGPELLLGALGKAGSMLQLQVQSTLPLARQTDDDQEYVTWLGIDVVDRDVATGELTRIAHARVAIVHIATMFLDEVDYEDVLGEEGLDTLPGCIEAYDGLFDLQAGDVLYLSRFVRTGGWCPDNLDIAMVQVLYDTFAPGAALVVVPYVEDEADRERWLQAGFVGEPEMDEDEEPVNGVPAFLCWDTRDGQDRIRVDEAA